MFKKLSNLKTSICATVGFIAGILPTMVFAGDETVSEAIEMMKTGLTTLGAILVLIAFIMLGLAIYYYATAKMSENTQDLTKAKGLIPPILICLILGALIINEAEPLAENATKHFKDIGKTNIGLYETNKETAVNSINSVETDSFIYTIEI